MLENNISSFSPVVNDDAREEFEVESEYCAIDTPTSSYERIKQAGKPKIVARVPTEKQLAAVAS